MSSSAKDKSPPEPDSEKMLDALGVSYDKISPEERNQVAEFLKKTAATLHGLATGKHDTIEEQLMETFETSKAVAEKTIKALRPIMPPIKKPLFVVPKPTDPDAPVTSKDLYDMEMRLMKLISDTFGSKKSKSSDSESEEGAEEKSDSDGDAEEKEKPDSDSDEEKEKDDSDKSDDEKKSKKKGKSKKDEESEDEEDSDDGKSSKKWKSDFFDLKGKTGITYKKGVLKWGPTAGGTVMSKQIFKKGIWKVELKWKKTTSIGKTMAVGICEGGWTAHSNWMGNDPQSMDWNSSGPCYHRPSSGSGSATSSGNPPLKDDDLVGLELNMKAKTLHFWHNKKLTPVSFSKLPAAIRFGVCGGVTPSEIHVVSFKELKSTKTKPVKGGTVTPW